MNKKYFLIALLSLLSTYSYAQSALPEFAPHGAHWSNQTYITDATVPDSYLQFWDVANVDTVVEGKTCRMFIQKNIVQYFAYRDSLKIWVHVNNPSQHWQLLYDFGWATGTQVIMPVIGYYFDFANTNNTFDTLPQTIIRTGDTVINGFTLPILETNGITYPNYGSVIIMNIGWTSNFLVPSTNVSSETTTPFLRCYHDGVIGQLKAPGVLICDTVPAASVPIVTAANEVQLYPNPATDVVHYTVNNVLSLNVLSIDGRVIQTIAAPTNTIAVTNMVDGVYLVVFHLKDGSALTKRLIVQR